MANVRLTLLSGDNSKYIVCDSDVTAEVEDKVILTKGGKTVTLPTSPAFGTKVVVKNDGGSATTVSRGGSEDVIGNSGSTSFSVGAGTTYEFVIQSAKKWAVKQLTGTYDSVQLKMSDAFVFATITAGVKTIVQQSSNLK
jgi:hypothetical protein